MNENDRKFMMHRESANGEGMAVTHAEDLSRFIKVFKDESRDTDA